MDEAAGEGSGYSKNVQSTRLRVGVSVQVGVDEAAEGPGYSKRTVNQAVCQCTGRQEWTRQQKKDQAIHNVQSTRLCQCTGRREWTRQQKKDQAIHNVQSTRLCVSVSVQVGRSGRGSRRRIRLFIVYSQPDCVSVYR